MTSAISMSGSSMVSMQAKLQQQLFSKVDANGDKAIDKTELTSFLNFVSEKTGTGSVDSQALLESIDTDGNGAISESELQDNSEVLFDQLRAQLMSSEASQAAPPPPPHGDAGEMFAGIDSDGDGAISKTELESFLSDRTSETGDGPSADELLARDDADGDGSISLAEFTEATSRRGEPPSEATGGGQEMSRLIASLLDQYSAIGSESTSVTETLSVTV